jgi:hypothetical protein
VSAVWREGFPCGGTTLQPNEMPEMRNKHDARMNAEYGRLHDTGVWGELHGFRHLALENHRRLGSLGLGPDERC